MDDPVISIPDTATDRYATFELISWWRQDVVRNATVMVVGAGALGNEVLKNLALMGIGRLLIIDFDTIEDANLSRSVLFRQQDRGQRKAEVAAQRIRDLNPDVQTQALHADVNDVGLGLFRRMDAIIGCLDNRQARLSVNRSCWHLGKPWVDGAIQDLYGVARVFWPGRGACYECTLTELDWQILRQRYSCPWLARQDIQQGKVPTTPIMASVIGSIQVQETLKLLHGMPVAAGKGIFFNGRANEVLLTEYPVRDDCQSHWRFESVTELSHATAKDTRVGELLRLIQDEMGEGAFIELDHDLVISWRCVSCGATEDVLVPLHQLHNEPAVCSQCGGARTIVTTHRLTGTERFIDRTLTELGVPPLHVLAARKNQDYYYFELTGDAEDVMQFH
jgi:molybdopterin/thiamine biosynthesis adenylyltransferase